MSDSFLNATSLEADRVSTKRLEMNGVASTRFAEGAEDEQVSLRDIAMVGYVSKALQPVKQFIHQLDPDGTFLSEFHLISPNLVDPYFSKEDEWILRHWEILNHQCIYAGTGYYDNNKLTVTPAIFTGTGTYLIICTIETITGGKLELVKNDVVEHTATVAGTYYWEVEFENLESDAIYLQAKGVPEDGRIILSYATVYHISKRFKEYICKKFAELSPVDMSRYVNVEQYEAFAAELANNMQAFMTDMQATMSRHTTVANPHGITPTAIGAANADHEHLDYLRIDALSAHMQNILVDYSRADHVHQDYVTKAQLSARVESALQARFEEILGADRLTVTQAPEGVLPSRFTPTDVLPPIQILLPSTISHTGSSSYDYYYGDVSTNQESLMHEAPKIFAPEADSFGTIPAGMDPTGKPFTFRMKLHCKRKLIGYRIITSDNAVLQQWDVYNGNTSFLHRVNNPSQITVEDGKRIFERRFSGDVTTDCISFIIQSVSVLDEADWRIRIEFITNDFGKEDIPITNEGFSCVIPTNGVNQLVTVQPSINHIVLHPEVVLPELPYYVFLSKDSQDSIIYNLSVFPPEYGNTRKGINALMDKFKDIERDASYAHEVYKHPLIGDLELATGQADAQTDLRNIYSSKETGWVSAQGEKKVVFTQTFKSNNVMLMGYMLDWREAEAPFIPEGWTLTITGYNRNGELVNTVFDSVKNFYPFYSAEDDDIIYHYQTDVAIHVKKIELTIQTTKENSRIAVNKVYFYLSERYFSIPENTMYLGYNKTTEMCLGYATYDALRGFVPVNLCLGKCCVIPVNNLKEVSALEGEYIIPNPFFTDHVCCDVQNYQAMDSSTGPDAYIASVAAKEIHITVGSAFTHALAISRQW